MKYSELENMLIIDKNGEKIGKIIRIDMLSLIGDDEGDYFAIIQIHHLIRRNHHFPIPLNTLVLTRVQENTLRLDMIKKEFSKIVKQYDTERKLKAKNADLAKASDINKAIALSAWARY